MHWQSHSIFSIEERQRVQIVAAVCSFTSLAIILVTFNWFCRMKKRLRHKLIMLHVMGSFIRALWYLSFSIIVLSGVPVVNKSPICQASGFFINMGNEVTDVSILFVTLHGALQVFRPSMSEYDVDGLDPYRYWIYALIILLPILLSALPFIKKDLGYQFNGAFCNLPLRPIWYRLALAWILRYAIALIITIVNVYVYLYVDKKFKGFSRTSTDLSLSAHSRSAHDLEAQPKSPRSGTLSGRRMTGSFDWRRGSSAAISRISNRSSPKAVSLKDATPTQARSSGPRPFDSAFSHRDSEPLSPTSQVPPHIPQDHLRASEATTSSKFTSVTENSNASLAPLKEEHTPNNSDSFPPVDSDEHDPREPKPHYQDTSPTEEATKRTLEAQRAVLQRQLRNNFIYPLIYLATWTIPLIATAMQFTNKYAQSTPGWLGILSVFSLTGMGAVDCLAFLWKERPWRTVPESRRWGRLGLQNWRRNHLDKRRVSIGTTSSTSNREREGERDIEMQTLGSAKKKERMRNSDRRKMARERALERLALERQDRRAEAFLDELAAGAGGRERGRE